MRTYATALGLLTTTAVALTGEGGIPPDAFIAATVGVGPSSQQPARHGARSTATITGNPQNMIIGALSHIPSRWERRG